MKVRAGGVAGITAVADRIPGADRLAHRHTNTREVRVERGEAVRVRDKNPFAVRIASALRIGVSRTGNSAGKVKVKDAIRKQVSFQRFNLMEEFPWHNEMDVIFCRNVMIYFDRPTQEKLIGKFYNCLNRGGYLFIGHSESIANLKHNFVQVEATTYQKP